MRYNYSYDGYLLRYVCVVCVWYISVCGLRSWRDRMTAPHRTVRVSTLTTTIVVVPRLRSHRTQYESGNPVYCRQTRLSRPRPTEHITIPGYAAWSHFCSSMLPSGKAPHHTSEVQHNDTAAVLRGRLAKLTATTLSVATYAEFERRGSGRRERSSRVIEETCADTSSASCEVAGYVPCQVSITRYVDSSVCLGVCGDVKE